MRTGSKQKLKYVIILEILRQETDADHPMQTNTLLKKLEEQGIECSRETLYIKASEISVKLGASWVDVGIYKQCLWEMLGLPYWAQDGVEIFYNKHDGSWKVDITTRNRMRC